MKVPEGGVLCPKCLGITKPFFTKPLCTRCCSVGWVQVFDPRVVRAARQREREFQEKHLKWVMEQDK